LGSEGGAGGTLGTTSIIDEDGKERWIPKIEVLRLAAGETVRIVSPGGGGYGDPLERAPEAVVRDIEDGFVTVEEARNAYGVVIKAGAVDVANTTVLRGSLKAKRGMLPAFEIGDERRAYEERLPQAFQDVVNEVLASEPASSRLYLRDVIYQHCFEEGYATLEVPRLRALIANLQSVATRPSLTRLIRSEGGHSNA
jgi:N-methylhydantoinase B